MIAPVPSCIHLVPLSKRMSSPIMPMIESVWKFLPWWAMSSLTLESEKVLFHSEHSIEFMDQGDRVIEHNTRRVVKHNPILQGAMSSMHGRKKWHGWPRGSPPFQLSWYPISFLLLGQGIVHHFLCPLLLNLETRFLLWGRIVTPCVTKTLINLVSP
jgi:hypothetical protein